MHWVVIISMAAAGVDCIAPPGFAEGNTLMASRHYSDAANQYRRALGSNPAHWQSRVNLGEVLASQEEWEPAASEYKRAIELMPHWPASYSNLGIVLGKQAAATGDPSKAVQGLQMHRLAVELAPHSKEANFNLGSVLLRTGDNSLTSEAAHHLKAAMEGASHQLRQTVRETEQWLGCVLRRCVQILPHLREALFHQQQ